MANGLNVQEDDTNLIILVVEDVHETLVRLTCASDFEFFVRPLGPQIITTPQLPNLFGEKNILADLLALDQLFRNLVSLPPLPLVY